MLIVCVICFAVLFQVVSRFILKVPLSWTEELSRFALIWLTFVAASVALRGNGRVLRLQIRDRGNGFDPLAVQSGMGILNMEERTRLIHGRFRLRTRPGSGVSITVEVPLPAQSEKIDKASRLRSRAS